MGPLMDKHHIILVLLNLHRKQRPHKKNDFTKNSLRAFQTYLYAPRNLRIITLMTKRANMRFVLATAAVSRTVANLFPQCRDGRIYDSCPNAARTFVAHTQMRKEVYIVYAD